MVAGGFALALKHGLKPGQNQFRGERPRSSKQEVAAENRPSQCSQGSSEQPPPLAVTVADCLLLCVLQEPLPEPSVAHIQALLCRLESVSHALAKAATGPEAAPDGPDRDSALEHKVQAVVRYLEQRTASLRALIREQRDLEAGVKGMLGGLGGLWTQLEELHTGVTLTKEAGRGYRDLASAQTDAKTLFSVSAHYRNRLESCQANLKACTERLQELMWSHAHTSSSVSSSGESRWPELLLQSNIEQFDKVQESFLSLQQQTRTFQAHLEGLGPGSQEAQEAQEAQAAEARSATAPCSSRPPHQRTCASVDAEAETLSFCERSALQLSSTIKHLRKPGKRK
ncbi:uncharacterized protein si:ch211-151h10.2 isoform X2 [Betta splendens]|nr:uncharacterized protein si:ch211-151h10.2 isoform X2 [Betta splendens]